MLPSRLSVGTDTAPRKRVKCARTAVCQDALGEGLAWLGLTLRLSFSALLSFYFCNIDSAAARK